MGFGNFVVLVDWGKCSISWRKAVRGAGEDENKNIFL
jgi:hypothetical protein